MDLPSAAQAYFEADGRADADAVVQAFAADAVVGDEGASHAGHEAIRAWWLAAKKKYGHVVEPLERTEKDGTLSVRTKVSGNFPNSPATLDFIFRFEGDKIIALDIH